MQTLSKKKKKTENNTIDEVIILKLSFKCVFSYLYITSNILKLALRNGWKPSKCVVNQSVIRYAELVGFMFNQKLINFSYIYLNNLNAWMDVSLFVDKMKRKKREKKERERHEFMK